MVCVLLANMSKAFDRVDHARLFQHLTTLNLCPQLLAWLYSYTTRRRQRVVANGKSSEWKVVTSGVPQGGVVSPYLFLLHMSTREVIFGDTLDTVYADDIGISRAVKLKDIETDKAMEMEALALETRAQNNNMLLNGNKSVKIRKCFAKKSIQPPPLILEGQEVPVLKL
uniref:Reverse transcriptase domain-containing protein n=1 Tax=Sinocyclocheilus anshuiensis TaxID=1608454 RepID=A0A671TA91_9TELE